MEHRFYQYFQHRKFIDREIESMIIVATPQ